jgi:hypothetical protein
MEWIGEVCRLSLRQRRNYLRILLRNHQHRTPRTVRRSYGFRLFSRKYECNYSVTTTFGMFSLRHHQQKEDDDVIFDSNSDD